MARVKGQHFPTRGELSLTAVLHALSDPVRLEIVRQLDEVGEKSCSKFGFDSPKSSLSHHFRILRESGVIASEGQGTILMNWVRREDLEARFPGLLRSILASTSKLHTARKRRT